MPDHNHLIDPLSDPLGLRQRQRLLQTLIVLRRSDWASAPTRGDVFPKHAAEVCGMLAREAIDTAFEKSTAQRLYIHSCPTIQNLLGDQ